MTRNRLSVSLLMLVGCLAVGDAWAESALCLAEGGKTTYTIVRDDTLGKDYDFVIGDFIGLLEKATAVKFKVVMPPDAPVEKRIFLGRAPKGYDTASLADQEHCIVTRGNDLYLFGGGANGTRYAMYSLLQKHLGFRFFDTHGGVKYPDGPLVLPQMNVRSKPPFRFRYLNGETGMFNRPDSTVFLVRHGQNSWSGGDMERAGLPVPPDESRIRKPHAHSLRYYLPADSKEPTFGFISNQKGPDLKSEHPEYFTMNEQGVRVFDSQYCLSNPGCRKLLSDRILENMRINPDCNIFDISAGDSPGPFCHCPGCKALIDRYGSVAGPLIDFVVEFCPRAKKLYPGNFVVALAYRKNQTQPPPTGIARLPDNFMPNFAPIDDNFAKDWLDPSNTKSYEDLKGWCRLCENVMVWYYPNPYGTTLTPPFGCVERGVTDLLLMEKAGVNAHMWEHNVGVSLNVGFTEIETYVFARMMNDTSLDWRTLAEEFIAFEYGAAAPLMRDYWLEQENLRKTTPLEFLWNANPSCFRHLTPERLVRWERDFDRMEKLVKDDPERLYAVKRVRVNLDFAVILDYANAKKAGFSLPIGDLGSRIMALVRRVCKDYVCSRCEGRHDPILFEVDDAVSAATIQGGRVPPPLPKDLFGEVNPDRVFTTIPKVKATPYENDPDAAFGVAAVFTDKKRGAKLPITSAFEDIAGHKYHRLSKIKAEDLPPHGKYGFFRMGEFTITPSCVFRAGIDDGGDFKADIGRAWEFGSRNRATGWMSLKFEGGAFYPEDAGKPNRVLCDRAVIIRE